MIKMNEERIFIEDFSDVVTISQDKVELLFKTYHLIIEGKKLQVAAFSKTEMILFGQISSVVFSYNDV